MSLSHIKIRGLKSAAKLYKVADGEGLHLLINANGSKLWRLSYRFAGKQKTIALSAYPTVTLLDARGAKDSAKRALVQGQDPGHLKRGAKRAVRIASANTFQAVGEEWLRSQKESWVESYFVRVEARLRDDVFPQIGHLPIAKIKPIDVLDAVRVIENRGAYEMARPVLQYIGSIFRYAVASSSCERDVTADIKDALKARPAVKHRAALGAGALKDFLERVDAYQGEPVTALALKPVVQTFVRR